MEVDDLVQTLVEEADPNLVQDHEEENLDPAQEIKEDHSCQTVHFESRIHPSFKFAIHVLFQLKGRSIWSRRFEDKKNFKIAK